jgi:hypothetical protein
MLTLPAAGQRIQREVQEAEAALNEALAKAAALTASCALARNLPGVGANTGHSALLHLAALSQHLTKGAGELARVHGDLRAINRDLVVMMPDADGNCPPATGTLAITATA